MSRIDFLPASYRESRVQRRFQLWRLLVIAAYVALVAAVYLGQRARRGALEGQLAEVRGRHAAAVEQQRRIEQLQEENRTRAQLAELLVYLRHPWPRSQLLRETVYPLPDPLVLQRLELRRRQPDAAQMRAEVLRGARGDRGPAALSAAQQDLADLRRECDAQPYLMVLAGTTDDQSALHRYLAELAQCRLFRRVELQSVDARAATGTPDGVHWEFQIAVTVAPGYGQPGGPATLTAHGNEASPAPRH